MENEKMNIKETRKERFTRLAEKRVNKAIDLIRIIGNLSSQQYEFTTEQIEKIIVALKAAIEELEEKFQKPLDKESNRWHF